MVQRWTICPHQHMNGALPVHPFPRRFSLTDGVSRMGGKDVRARRFASEGQVTWAVKPNASLADLATIDLRRIADVLQVDHASLYLRDPDDPRRAAVVAEIGLPVGEALPEHRMLLSRVLQHLLFRRAPRPGGHGRRLQRRTRHSAATRGRGRRRGARRDAAAEPAAGRHRFPGHPEGDADAGRTLSGARRATRVRRRLGAVRARRAGLAPVTLTRSLSPCSAARRRCR